MRSRVDAFAADHGVHALDDVALAVSEALTNAVVHAYVGAEPGEVRVVAERSNHDIVIVVEDDGCGLCPREDSPGLGLGLMVIAEVTQRFELTAGAGGAGTRLVLTFAIAGPAATAPV